MKREDVEALMHEARESGGSVGHVDATYLYALCRRWLAVESAPVVLLWSGDRDGEFVAGTPEQADAIQTGCNVRIVPEQGEG